MLTSFSTHRRRFASLLILVLGLLGAAACSRAINPVVIDDALAAARVKTAIINDPTLGSRPIDVRVVRGVASLAGEVGSAEEADRLVALVRAVPGVSDVRSTVRVVGAPAASTETAPRARLVQTERLDETSDEPRLLAVGGSFSWTDPRQRARDGGASIGPLVRFGAGKGLAATVDFNWYAFDLYSGADRSHRLGHVSVRPVMAGVGYRLGREKVSAEFSVAGGLAFNAIRISDDVSGVVALRVDRSLVWRPGVTAWYDLNRHVALNSFVGYVMTRPSAAYLENGRIDMRTLRADTLLVGAGVAYKLF